MKDVFSVKEAIQKIEHFCTYQERCHEEVATKLRSMKLDSSETDIIIVHLITQTLITPAIKEIYPRGI